VDLVEHAGDILNMIHEEQKLFKNKYKYSSEIYNRLIESTGWIFTYHTYKKDNPLLRLAVYHPNLGEGFGIYEKGNPAIIPPFEATKEERELIGSFFEDSFKYLTKTNDFKQNLQNYCKLIFLLIKEIQPKYPSISKYVQYGIHTYENLVGISRIIKNEQESFNIQLDPLT